MPASEQDRSGKALSMKLLEFLVPQAITIDLQATDKEGVIREIVGRLRQAGALAASDCESVIKAILSREELGSTGIGRGVAVPHTRHPSVDKLVACIATSKKGVEFASLDDQPAYVFFLLISPPNQPGPHLRALDNAARYMRDDQFVDSLRAAESPEAVISLIRAMDDQHNSGS
jgi:mannitol/fructose-specific phosphotransferase system IIA component (Ntr-type)